MSRESIIIEWTPKQLKQLQPLFEEINQQSRGLGQWWIDGDGLLGQVYTHGMQVRYIENKEVLAIQKINVKAQKQGRQIK